MRAGSCLGLRVLLDDESCTELLCQLAEGCMPGSVVEGLRVGRLVALSKPGGGIRALVSRAHRRLRSSAPKSSMKQRPGSPRAATFKRGRYRAPTPATRERPRRPPRLARRPCWGAAAAAASSRSASFSRPRALLVCCRRVKVWAPRKGKTSASAAASLASAGRTLARRPTGPHSEDVQQRTRGARGWHAAR